MLLFKIYEVNSSLVAFGADFRTLDGNAAGNRPNLAATGYRFCCCWRRMEEPLETQFRESDGRTTGNITMAAWKGFQVLADAPDGMAIGWWKGRKWKSWRDGRNEEYLDGYGRTKKGQEWIIWILPVAYVRRNPGNP